MSVNKSITNWVIVLNPLQLKNTLTILENREIDIVYYTENIDLSEIGIILPQSKLIKIPANIFKKDDIFKAPWKTLIHYRKVINHFLEIVEKYLSFLDRKANVYCGSDKNVYVQALTLKLREKGKLSSLISVDEGAGHYCKEKPNGPAKEFLYKLLSKILLGIPYDYVDVMGTWKHVSEIWVRWPEKLGYRAKGKKYFKIPSQSNYKIVNKKLNSKNVLILSSPLAMDKFVSIEKEYKILHTIIKNLKNKDCFITIKPHPRDELHKFEKLSNEFQINILNSAEIAENLDYWDYGLVINFGSSVILDMLNVGYPSNRIITLDVIGICDKVPLFLDTKVCYQTKDAEILISMAEV